MGRKDSRCQDPEKRACLMHSRESRGVNIKQQGQLYWEARDVGARPARVCDHCRGMGFSSACDEGSRKFCSEK